MLSAFFAFSRLRAIKSVSPFELLGVNYTFEIMASLLSAEHCCEILSDPTGPVLEWKKSRGIHIA